MNPTLHGPATRRAPTWVDGRNSPSNRRWRVVVDPTLSGP
jgi:hypothetical protein